jgi:L-ascorbate metabolism protein UlaG (beta-lactamase superfamily)
VARIVYVGHATVLVDLDGVRLLTDPLLRTRVAHLRRAMPVPADALRGVDAVLLSHLHYDHLDLPSLQRLGRTTPLVVPKGSGGLVRRKGFGDVTELAVGEELSIGPVRVRATPAEHDAGRLPFGVRADPLGYVLSGTCTVYFAGDTDLFDGMAALGPVDVALVPIAGWGKGLGPGHLDPERAARALTLLRPRIAIPIHWGTYFPAHAGLRRLPGFLETPPALFTAKAAELAPEVEVRVLRPGESADLPDGEPRRA